jgi:sarcosine oxidase, subunit beta
VQAKALIVGGGVMGVSIALNLARRYNPIKQPIIVLERGQIGGGSSGSSGALLRQHYEERAIASVARDSMREYAGFEAKTGRSVGFRRSGVLTLAGPSAPRMMERVRSNIASQEKIGIRTSLLDAAGIRQKMPGIEVHDQAIAAWEPGGGYVDPQLCVREFAALARSYGAATRTGVGIEELIVSGGRIQGVKTDQGEIRAEQVVIVAGAWSRRLLEPHGVKLPVRVARVEQHFVALPIDSSDQTPESAIPTVNLEDPLEEEAERLKQNEEPHLGGEHPVLIDLEYGFYARPEPLQHRTRICPISYQEGEIFDEPSGDNSVTAARAAEARELLCKRLPFYRDLTLVGSQVGWFPLTPDGRAVMGAVPKVDGLFIATGFADHGFKLAPSVGEGMAQLMAGEVLSAFDKDYFGLHRFERPPANEEWSGTLFL